MMNTLVVIHWLVQQYYQYQYQWKEERREHDDAFLLLINLPGGGFIFFDLGNASC